MENTYNLGNRELRFYYSVGARCDISEFIVKHGGLNGLSADLLTVQQAVAMHRAYLQAHDITDEKPVTEKELRNLPAVELNRLSKVLDDQVKIDSGITVETEDVKGKNAKSGAAKK